MTILIPDDLYGNEIGDKEWSLWILLCERNCGKTSLKNLSSLKKLMLMTSQKA